MEPNNLQRFLDAQETSYKTALKEIKNGAKKSHWMWYIFPQYKGLGYSDISKKYAIKTREEAIAYVEHPILGKRLVEISGILLNHTNKTAYEIFGWPDDAKLRSSMTLFTLIQKENDIFQQVLNKYFDGKICWKTEKLIIE